MEKLIRVPKELALVEVPPTVRKESRDLAADAQNELGYSNLSRNVELLLTQRSKIIVQNKIVKALDEIGIELLDVNSVGLYMKELRSEVRLKSKQSWEWDIANLKYYPEPIPEFALERAIQVKRVIIAAQLAPPDFYVAQLKRESVRHPDPFMLFSVAQSGDKQYYLDVWDEPKFEGRRTI